VKKITQIPKEVRARYTELVEQLLKTYHSNNGKIESIPPSQIARAAIRKYKNALVVRRRKEWRDISSFVARWHEQAWRILVVLHAATHRERAHISEIEQENVDAAIQLADWFGAQQLRLLRTMRDASDQEALNKLMNLCTRTYEGKATLRDLERRNCYKREELERLCARFPRQIAIIRPGAGEKGGRPREVLQVSQVLA
jgi:hypothetical protein